MRSCNRPPIAQTLLLALLAALPARAEIAGEQVMSGTATFEQAGSVTTIHASDGAIIHYSQLDVRSNEELHFVQPSSESRVLNRVFGDATHIDGGLYANGIVYIVNPAGIYYGPFAVVDVGGLYAGAGDISNEDFLARVDRFTLSGAVENAGSIESPAVALLGTAVANHGNIHAPDGTIALVAGDKVLLTQLGAHVAVAVEGAGGSATGPAIEQTGTVDAGAGTVSFATGDVYSLAINHTGITRGREIELRAGSGTVQVAGELDASDRSAGGTGGSIAVTGERVALLGAQLDASGDAGGGAIRVGGDLRGQGELPTARRTYVDEASALRADAISAGDGGDVIVWADEATAFHGSVSARGGAAGGDGGFAEISGAFLAADGSVDLGAASGEAGTLLYDPKDIAMHAGTPGTPAPDDADGSDSSLTGSSLGSVLFGDTAALNEPFDVYESELQGTNANIVLQATNSIRSADTFEVRIIDGNSLTMQTRNNAGDETGTALAPGIHLDGVSFETGGTGAITIATGTDGATGGGTGSPAGVEVGDLTTAGGAVAITTKDGAIAVGDVTTEGAAGAVDGTAGGVITLTANDADQSGGSSVTTGVLDSSGGDGGTGAGGRGGNVTVRSIGAVEDIAGTFNDPTLGGGSITVAGINATGGAGAAAGGAGGAVATNTTDGSVTATGDIDSSGGAGGTTGGNAGSIAIATRDANGDTPTAPVSTEALIARGGSGANGAGGRGGAVNVNTRQSIEITGATDPDDDQAPAGGGAVAIASIDTRGGAGTEGNGGQGGNVTVATESGNVSTGTIRSGGGAGDNAADTAVGGRGGNVTLRAGTAEEAASDLHLVGNIDAREGTSDDPETLATDGGNVTLFAGDDIAHSGQAGPHIRTGGDVSLTARGDIGSASPIQVEGHEVEGRAENRLSVSAGATARVNATNEGFLGALNVTATSDAADIRVTQSGGDIVELVGSPGANQVFVNEVDTRANDVDVFVRFDNPDEAAPDGDLVLRTGAGSPVINSGGAFDARSAGDVVVGTANGTVIRVADVSDPDTTEVAAGTVLLAADQDFDGEGGIRRGSAGAVIDMLGAADTPGDLVLFAADGIGAAGAPIRVSGGGRVSALNSPLTEDPENEGEFVADPDATSGIYVRNVASSAAPTSELEIARSSQFPNDLVGAVVSAGTGDIEFTNEVGDLHVTGIVRTRPVDPDDGDGGNLRFAVQDPASAIVLDTALAIVSGGEQIYDGDVALARNTEIDADEGVELHGSLDTDADAASEARFTATIGAASTSQVDGPIGGDRALSAFTVQSDDPATATLALGGGSVETTGAQTYRTNITLGQNTVLTAGTSVELAANVMGGTADFTANAPGGIRFSGSGAQSVATAGDIALNPAGRADVPPEATVAKSSGNLSLASSGGSVSIGDREKVSVAGSLAIAGDTVRFTDLSALDIAVTSPDAQVFAREAGAVNTASGAAVMDGGTDVIANTVAFSTAPTVVGGGPAPRIGTPSGTAQNTGALAVGTLPVPIAASDIALGSRVFDLAIPAVDPGHETQEIVPTPLEPPIEPQASQDRAAPGAPVSSEEVVAFLACAPLGEEYAPSGCEPTDPPVYGSALDTERAVEVAHAYRELLGDSPSTTAGRTALANAALDPRADLGSATSPAGRAYLSEVARVLGQVRLLGLGEGYREVRGDLLDSIAHSIGSPQLDAARLGAAVDARAMGMPI